MRSLAHMREMDEALEDWGLDMETVYQILQNDRMHLVKFREEVKRILLQRSRGGQ